MAQFFTTLAIIFVAFAVSFILINIRHIITGQEFRGTCSTNNPMIKDKFGSCSVCGKSGDEPCGMPEKQTA